MDKKVEQIGCLLLILVFFYLYTWQSWSMELYIMDHYNLPVTLGLTMPLWAILAGISMNLPKFAPIKGIDWWGMLIQGVPAGFLAFGPQLNFVFLKWTGINTLAGFVPANWIFFLDKLDLPMVGGLWLGIVLSKCIEQE